MIDFEPDTAVRCPRNWLLDPALGLRTRNNGAWVHWRFTGPCASLLLDVSAYHGKPASSYPGVQWECGPASGRIQTVPETNEYPLSVYGEGPHDLRFWHEISDNQQNRWASEGVEFRLLGLRCAEGATLLPVETPTEHLLVFGDSIVGGSSQLPSSQPYRHNPRSSWVWLHALAVGTSVSIVSSPGTGWVSTTTIPPFHVVGQPAQSSWRYLWEGQPAPTVAPTRVLTTHGHNDGNNPSVLVTARVLDWFVQARQEWPQARLEALIPLSQRKTAAIRAGFEAYQAASGDHNIRLWDLGPMLGFNVDLGTGVPTCRTSDGVHPTAATHALLATLLTKLMQE